MTNYLVDASGLVKRYVSEIVSVWVRSILSPSSGHRIFVAQITPVEVISALMRRKREGNIADRTAQAAHVYVNRHTRREYQLVRLTDGITLRAENLLAKYPLKAADAIQLASAIQVNAIWAGIGIAPLIFVAADQKLLQAALAEGLQTENPNLYP